jgi:hypothetical protein
MSECGVCLTGGDDGGSTEFIHTRILCARQKIICCECGGAIEPGKKYEYAAGKTDGDFWNCKTCLVCAEIANAFYCQGRWYGGMLWEGMDEIWESFTTGCLTKLKTAAAKAECIHRWREWKFRNV